MISTPMSVMSVSSSTLYARLVRPSAAETTQSSTTARLSERPWYTSRCEVWSRPPRVTGRPSRIRTMVTSVVSRIGTARTRIGSSSVATVEPATVQLAASPSEARAKPSTWLPLSPMKTAAGLFRRRLYGRKPMQAKQMPSESTATVLFGWTVKASMAKNRQAIAASVAARPSMLSSRLNAFVIPISQRSPSAVARMSLETISTRTPAAITTTAAATCAPIFASGDRR